MVRHESVPAPYGAPVSGKEPVRASGEQAVGELRQLVARRVAAMLRRDPKLAGAAIETGLVSRDWLDDPTSHSLRGGTFSEVVERFLEREAEQRPSVVTQLGLSAVQLLAARREDDASDGTGACETLTIAFTDLVGFTEYTATEGDAAASELLARHYRTSGPIVRSRGGRTVKRLGDGLLLSFPAPEAAVLACTELSAAPPAPLALRAGAHVGEVRLLFDDVVGHVVNVAARVTELAGAGEVLVTADVAGCVEDLPGVRVGPARRCDLKGVPDPIDIAPVEPQLSL